MFAISYLVITALSAVIILCLNLTNNIKIIIISLLFMIFAVIIVPRTDSILDILKYFKALDAIRAARLHSISSAWQVTNANPSLTSTTIMTFSSTPVMALIMLGMSYFPNIALLALVVFIDYYFALKIIQIIIERNHLSNQYFCYAFIIFCCLFAYSIAVSGVRNNLVGTVFAYAVLKYDECHPSLFSFSTLGVLVLAILLSLIHPFTILLVLFWVITILLTNKLLYLADTLMFCQRFFQQAFLQVITPLTGLAFFASLSIKSTQYLGKNATIGISSMANYFRDISRLVVLLLLLIVVIKFSKTMISSRYTEFVILLFCFIFGSFQDQLLFERCTLVLLPIMLPYITILPKQISQEYHQQTVSLKYVLSLNMLIILSLFALICLIDNLRAGVQYYMLFWH